LPHQFYSLIDRLAVLRSKRPLAVAEQATRWLNKNHNAQLEKLPLNKDNLENNS
jgi:hypothetical protein